MPDHDETGIPRAVRPRRRRGISMLVTLLLLVPVALSVGVVVFNEAFPEETEVSCTVQESSVKTVRRFWVPKLITDCGGFRSAKLEACTSDPERKVQFIADATYDLVVRGPRIPGLSAPKVVSATLSEAQLNEFDPGIFEVDPSAPENLQELQRSTLPETLRAFDYEQPAFDPSCDVTRAVMTTNGVQLVTPAHAELLLTIPEGEIARDPPLPCDGPQCAR